MSDKSPAPTNVPEVGPPSPYQMKLPGEGYLDFWRGSIVGRGDVRGEVCARAGSGKSVESGVFEV